MTGRREYTCRGKHRWPDHQSAVKALRRLTSRSKRQTVPVRVYECEWCHGWHMTSERR